MANKTIGQLTNAATSSVTLDKQKTIVPIFQATSTENLANGATYNASFEQIINDFSLVQNGSVTTPIQNGYVANKEYVDGRETAIRNDISTAIDQASTNINNNINTAINGLPFWSLEEGHTFKGRYYFELNVRNGWSQTTSGKIILYYIPPYFDGTFNVAGTWYLTAKDDYIRLYLNSGNTPNIEIVNAQDSTNILTLESWNSQSTSPDYPYSNWACPVSYNNQNDPLTKNTSYYISGTAGWLTIISGNYTYKSDYYNGKQLSTKAVPYATVDQPGGIKIGNGLSISAWGECDVLLGNGLKFDSLNQIALNSSSLFTSFHAQGTLTHSAGNTWTKVGTFSIPAGKALIGSIKSTNASGVAYGLGWAYGDTTQYPQCTVYYEGGGYKVCPINFSPSDPTNAAVISIFTYRTSASNTANYYGVGGVLIDANYFGSYESDTTADSTATIVQV